MRKVLLIINFIIIVGFIGSAYGAPSVSGVSGTAGNQNQITIHGSGFGSNGLDYSWLGANIENGRNGASFSASGWGANTASVYFNPPKYTTSRSHSGNKSILSSYSSTRYGSGYWYGFGKEASKLYATYWIYVDLASMRGQNKLWRIMGEPQSFDDAKTVLMASQWNNNSSYVMLFSKGDRNSYWYSTSGNRDGMVQLYDDEIPGFSNWARVEIYFEGGTPNQKNGTFIYRMHKNGRINETGACYDGNLMIYGGTSMRAKAFTIQNYVGNAEDGHDRTGNEKIYTDDVFVQVGSQARVEIGDRSSWNSCTYREVQIPTSWSSSQIRTTVNTGTFSKGQTAYVYVVDANGNVNSQGYRVTIGSSSGGGNPPPAEAPDAPTGLEIVSTN